MPWNPCWPARAGWITAASLAAYVIFMHSFHSQRHGETEVKLADHQQTLDQQTVHGFIHQHHRHWWKTLGPTYVPESSQVTQ